MNTESWITNLKLGSIEIKLWKKEFIRKQRERNPLISMDELDKRIKNAKIKKFKDNFLIFEHPNYQYSQ